MSDPPAAPYPASQSADRVRRREVAVALRNGVKMGGSLIITWSVAIIVNLRVPARLGPVRQGNFGFAESFATMFFAIIGLGIDTHIMKEVAVRPKYASDIVGGVLALRLVMSLVLFAAMGGVLWVTGRPQEILLTAMVFGAASLTMAINATLGAVLQAISHVDPAVIANIATKVIWGVGLLVGLHYDVPLPVLALPGLIGEVLRALIMAPAASSAAELQYRIDLPALRAAVRESFPYFVNGLALTVLSSLVMSLLGFIRHDAREVGWFRADQNVAALCALLTPLLFWVVMPLLSRAHARSGEEGMDVFRRCVEGIVVVIAPITVMLSAGADIFIHLAFGDKYAPAHVGLSILSLVFAMTYVDTMLAMNLIVMGRGWSVTIVSIGAVFITGALTLLFVPLGRHLIREGGECAGAAAAVIGSEVCVFVAMVSRFGRFPFDARNIQVFLRTVAIGGVVLAVDRALRPLGAGRLAIDAALYAVLALALNVVRVQDVKRVVRLLRHRVDKEADPVVSTAA
jgi:O-antigen/teichoic acid export membrane protein